MVAGWVPKQSQASIAVTPLQLFDDRTIYIYKPIPPTHLRVFFSQGRLNHSCAPNLEFQLDWDEQQQTVVTLGPCLKEVRPFACHQVLHKSAVYIDMIYVYIFTDMIYKLFTGINYDINDEKCAHVTYDMYLCSYDTRINS